MKSLLITGGAGFIGSHLAESLVARKEEVYILDNLSTGQKKNLNKCFGKIRFIESKNHVDWLSSHANRCERKS